MKRFIIAFLILCALLIGNASAENRGDQTLMKLDSIVEELIRTEMSDYEKALVLHDWLVDHVDYQLRDLGSFHADSALLDGYGVCQSYTEAYNLLLSKAGLICKSIQTSLHEWTVVLLDDAWYHVDVTWDDSTHSNLFFAIPDFAIEHVEDHQTSGYCYSYQNNYAYKTGLLNSFIDEYKEKIQQGLNQGDRKFTVSVTTSIADDRYDIMLRTALIATIDQLYLIDGNSKKIDITVIYDNNSYQLSVDADTPLTEKPKAPDAPKLYDLSAVWDYSYPHSLTVRADVGGGSGGYVCTIKILNDNGTVFYDNGRAWSYLKPDDIYLPQGQYTVYIYETDGRTEISKDYQIDFSYLHYDLYLPDNLNYIESEAFSQSAIGPFVLCNNRLARIESKAFADCSNLQLIEIPESVQFIADDAFSGCTTTLIVTGLPGSYVDEYCKRNGLHFNGK